MAGDGRAKTVANWMLGDLTAHLNATGLSVTDVRVTPAMMAELVGHIEDGAISGKQAKDVFTEMAETGDASGFIIEKRGMKQVSDISAIESIVDALLAGNPDKVAQYRGGKTGLMGWFVGQVMREMRGQGNPAVVNEVLERKLAVS